MLLSLPHHHLTRIGLTLKHHQWLWVEKIKLKMSGSMTLSKTSVVTSAKIPVEKWQNCKMKSSNQSQNSSDRQK